MANIIQRSLLIEEGDLIKFIRENWRGLDSKDYELLTAVLLARFHKDKFNEKFHISLPVKIEIDQHLSNEYSYENIKKALMFLDEDSPVDIALVPETIMGSWPTSPFRRPRIKSQAFQIKRIGARVSGDRTQEVLTLLHTIKEKYAPVEAGLVLMIGGEQTTGRTDIGEIRLNFSPSEFPFKAIFFITLDSEAVLFGQIWPNFGCIKYDRGDLLGDIFIK